ncbi:MAG: methyltransferase [Thermodesulfobacteriota bacterium]|nr:methyltransferase [Thermodesulfobacteriota bacterium]
MKTIPEPLKGFEPVNQIFKGYILGQIISTSMKREIFSLLKRPKKATTLAEEISADPTITEKLLETLVSMDLLLKRDGRYVNTDLARSFLIKESVHYQGELIELILDSYHIWSQLETAMEAGCIGKTDEAPEENTFDKRFMAASAESAVRGALQYTVKAIAELPEFKSARRLLDLGGGHGLYSIAFARENPFLEAVVFDLPLVTEICEERIREYGMKGRVSVMAGDYLKDDFGTGFDAVFISHSILYKPEESFDLPLKKIHLSLNDGGIIIVRHWTRANDKNPLVISLWDLRQTLLGSSNRLYTEEEYLHILEERGFVRREVLRPSHSSDPSVIIVARKG